MIRDIKLCSKVNGMKRRDHSLEGLF